MNLIKAEVIADSLTPYGERCTTFVVNIPRIVLAEWNTHRMLSRNSASSRAIPFKTKIESMFTGANASIFVPLAWQKDHSGMQGTAYFSDEERGELDEKWLELGDTLRKYAEWFSDRNVTKQICNRILELHSYQTIICTATEWENFLALRAHDAAEIHIADVAYKMLEKMNESTPKQLKDGEWHIPFGDKMDNEKYYQTFGENPDDLSWVKIATARCARVSYMNYEGKDDYEADIKLYDRLKNMAHFSPFEHCAKVMTTLERDRWSRREKGKVQYGWAGNFKGFLQLRKTFEGENKSETRLVNKQ